MSNRTDTESRYERMREARNTQIEKKMNVKRKNKVMESKRKWFYYQ